MASDRERIEALERTVRLLAEATRDAFLVMRNHGHNKGSAGRPTPPTQFAVDRALGHLDAVLSTLGVGPAAEGGGA